MTTPLQPSSSSLFHLSYALVQKSNPLSIRGEIADTSDIEASTTSNLPVQITNSFSLVACLIVVITYFILRRKNQRIMHRPSLVLAVSMATADGVLHVGPTAAVTSWHGLTTNSYADH